MALFFITGVSATGKSSVTRELKKRGYFAYDTDDDGLARWQNNKTGYIHPKSSVTAGDRTEEFIGTHSWNVPREIVDEIARENPGKVVFICGAIANIDQLKELFSKIIALVIDEDTLRHRIATRTNNDWGKQPHELERTLTSFRRNLKLYASVGYGIIDASQPLDEVVNDVLVSCGLEASISSSQPDK